jgi:hypothetical protein
MDPVLGELELLNDHSSISFFLSREDALLEEQFQDHQADLERNQRSPPVSVGLGGSTTEAARAQKRDLAVSNWVKRVRQKELTRQPRVAQTRANPSSLHAVENLTDEPVVKSNWEFGDLSWEETYMSRCYAVTLSRTVMLFSRVPHKLCLLRNTFVFSVTLRGSVTSVTY